MVCRLRRSSTQPDTEARICIVDYESGIVAYDGLVKLPKPVIDYLTNLSSSQCTHTTDYLDGQASPVTTLSDVQTQLLAILAPQAGPISILIGHSLESDLKSLRICHPLCVDTALIYYPCSPPLKSGPAWLTEKRCQREIQTRGEGGYDPEEDAHACVDLLRLKAQIGAGFSEFKHHRENRFERMARACGRGGQDAVRVDVVGHGHPGVMHGARATTAIACGSDRDMLEGLIEVIPAHDFLCGRFTGIADAMGCECT